MLRGFRRGRRFYAQCGGDFYRPVFPGGGDSGDYECHSCADLRLFSGRKTVAADRDSGDVHGIWRRDLFERERYAGRVFLAVSFLYLWTGISGIFDAGSVRSQMRVRGGRGNGAKRRKNYKGGIAKRRGRCGGRTAKRRRRCERSTAKRKEGYMGGRDTAEASKRRAGSACASDRLSGNADVFHSHGVLAWLSPGESGLQPFLYRLLSGSP